MRGMGYLGLVQLVNFVMEHKDAAQQVYSDSVTYGYPMAISGINFSLDVYEWVTSRKATVFMYSAKGGPSLWAAHLLYCQLFCAFNQEWVRERPPNMLSFERIRSKVTKRCSTLLEANEELYSFGKGRPSRLMCFHGQATAPPSPASPSALL